MAASRRVTGCGRRAIWVSSCRAVRRMGPTVRPAGMDEESFACERLVDRVEQGVKTWPWKVGQQREELPIGQRADVGQKASRVDRGRSGCAVVEDSCRPGAKVEDGVRDGCWCH